MQDTIDEGTEVKYIQRDGCMKASSDLGACGALSPFFNTTDTSGV